MVNNSPLPGPTKGKRSLASMQDGYNGWESSPLGASTRPPVDLPFEHYAVIYWEDNKIKVAESPSIQEQSHSVFTRDVRDRFRDILGSKIGYQKPMLHNASMVSHAYSHSQGIPIRHGKRRRGGHAHAQELPLTGPEVIPQIPSPPAEDKVPVQIGDTKKVLYHYYNTLRHFQQSGCRMIAKAFIKNIEPKKQRDHPYNGNTGTGERDPEKTKPCWWPEDVVHREPDHIGKEDRLKLLVHILRKLGNLTAMHPKYKENWTSSNLQDVAQDSRRQLGPKKMALLNEIFKLRKLEEQFEAGERDGSTVTYVTFRPEATDKKTKHSAADDSDSDIEGDCDGEEEEEDTLAVPENLYQFPSGDPQVIQPRLHTMTSDPFNINESLNFGESSRQSRSFYPAPTDYTEDYSQSMLRPSTAALVPSEPAESFDYLTNAPFSAATTADHHRPMTMPLQPLNHYDTSSWDPAFRPNLYGTMEYGPSQTLTQNPMSYPMSINPSQAELPSTNAEMPHGLPDLTRGERTPHWSSLNKSF